ncbi:hypothetical protein [Enterovibrio norvegicus]|uniref:Uncharacterized protein n=1 Tax=Enterovibrio norvegicus TaxID=188144 RepID=A0A2N7L5Y9_9GAMM|nr:hypothetical protein [Enterovibrio norvegicus]PML77985.1 hypothetical protein BCT69_17505 [Enterovibrio norvegicus]PMN67253.1 hypothetical protein BCT27_04755 [Enterovibrio norvegicus]PMN89052.1 hypothetical protein BCT23_05990 [Enterovibrio norvegicus]
MRFSESSQLLAEAVVSLFDVSKALGADDVPSIDRAALFVLQALNIPAFCDKHTNTTHHIKVSAHCARVMDLICRNI